jgi:hypothetical protein
MLCVSGQRVLPLAAQLQTSDCNAALRRLAALLLYPAHAGFLGVAAAVAFVFHARRQHNMMNTRRGRRRGEPVSVGALPPQPQLRSALCRVHADLLLAVVSTQTHGGARADSFAGTTGWLTAQRVHVCMRP